MERLRNNGLSWLCNHLREGFSCFFSNDVNRVDDGLRREESLSLHAGSIGSE